MSPPSRGRGERAVRTALIVTGALLLGGGCWWAATTVPPQRWPSVLLWAGAAILVHDVVIAPLVTLVGRRVGRAVAGAGCRRAVRIALVSAACMTLVAIPGIAVRAAGPRNDSIHVVDYALVVTVVWMLALAVMVAAGSGSRRRQGRRARTK